MQKTFRFAFAATLTSFLPSLAACAVEHTSAGEARVDFNSEIVTPATFSVAEAAIASIDYLPFSYKLDGCYARALYMSMELAEKRIESNAIFAFAKGRNWLTVGAVTWTYHVAPMLLVQEPGGATSLMVIDPSISSTPFTQENWLGAMGFPATTPAASGPDTLMVPGSDYTPDGARADWTNHNRDVTDFAHMPAFNVWNIQDACNVMHRYVWKEPGVSDEERARKQNRLVLRTSELVYKLNAMGKLAGSAVNFSPDVCAAAR